MSEDTIALRCTSAFTFEGHVVRPGEVIHASPSFAANLLHRGRAEVVDGEAGLGESKVLRAGTAKTAKASRAKKPKVAANDEDSSSDGDDGSSDGDDGSDD